MVAVVAVVDVVAVVPVVVVVDAVVTAVVDPVGASVGHAKCGSGVVMRGIDFRMTYQRGRSTESLRDSVQYC